MEFMGMNKSMCNHTLGDKDEFMNVMRNIFCSNMNETQKKTLLDVWLEEKEESQAQGKLSPPVLTVIVASYIVLLLIGATGNGLIIYVVAKNRAMRVARNVFIVNLAISDFILCIFTQPFNLIRLLPGHQPWTLGNFMCKLTSMFQGTNVFISTMSITAIALDRYQVIVHPTRTAIKTRGAILVTVLMWIVSLLMASPLAVFSQVAVYIVRQCSEEVNPEMDSLRFAYSVASMLIQYLLPLVIVSFAYLSICLRLRRRMALTNGIEHKSTTPNEPLTAAQKQSLAKRTIELNRQKRTNTLLASITITFVLSSMPLNLCNVLMDLKLKQTDTWNKVLSLQFVLLIQSVCLLCNLGSAVINPILYGWLNDNFRREFTKMFHCIASRHQPDAVQQQLEQQQQPALTEREDAHQMDDNSDTMLPLRVNHSWRMNNHNDATTTADVHDDDGRPPAVN